MTIYESDVTYHKEIVRACTLVGINLQRETEEVAEHGRQSMLFLDRGCSVRCDKPERAKRTLVEVWRLSFDHLNGHDTEGPDVDLSAVLLPSHNFGCHPVRRAHHGRPLVVILIDLCAESEIGCRWVRATTMRKRNLHTQLDVTLQ
jgi:hypothetical protein